MRNFWFISYKYVKGDSSGDGNILGSSKLFFDHLEVENNIQSSLGYDHVVINNFIQIDEETYTKYSEGPKLSPQNEIIEDLKAEIVSKDNIISNYKKIIENMNSVTTKSSGDMNVNEYVIDMVGKLLCKYRNDEPLNGDEINELIKHIKLEVRFHEGDVDIREYDRLKELR